MSEDGRSGAEPEPRSRLEFDILYEDDGAVVVDKPGGVHVHRTYLSSQDRVFLLQEVRDRVGSHVYPVHRLDRAASGVIVFARSPEDARVWSDALASPDCEKWYLSMVRGRCPDAWCMERPLTSDGGEKKPARSTIERMCTFDDDRYSLVRVRIHTGRRHQIRRHLAHSMHQIVGDSTYGKGKINRYLRENHDLPRLFLHATRLVVRHPGTGDPLEIHSPLAGDLREFLGRYPGFPPELLREI